MSDTWNQANFERLIAPGELSFTDLLNDDSVNFLDDDALVPPAVDLGTPCPPLPELPSTVMNDDLFDFMGNDTLFDGMGELHGLDPVELQGPDVGDQSYGQAEGMEENILPSPVRSEPQFSFRVGNPAMIRAKTLHRCPELTCAAKYQRKGDLARHKRERHSNEEYLCPVSRCKHHTTGKGFQREYRLVNHLWKPRNGLSHTHPHLRKRTDAKFIASHYNNCVLAKDCLILNGSTSESGDYSAVAQRFVSLDVRDFSDVLKHYSEQLVTAQCPCQCCSKFGVLRIDSWEWYLEMHLLEDHALPLNVAVQRARSWQQAFRDELATAKINDK